MALYECETVDAHGRRAISVYEAQNERALAGALDAERVLLSCRHVRLNAGGKWTRRYKKDAIILFTDLLSSMIDSGMTIKDSVSVCGSISADAAVRRLCVDIASALEKGRSLGTALDRLSPDFSPLYRALVRLGEKTGDVSDVFFRMSKYLHAERKIARKILSAMIYPLSILGISLIGCIGILVYVMPRMTEIVSAFRVDEGESVARSMETVMTNIWVSIALIVACVIIAVAFRIARCTCPSIALFTDALLLRLPKIGAVIRAHQTLEFAFAMEMLLAAGIPVAASLKEAASVIKNRAYAAAIERSLERVLRGDKLSDAFAASSELPLFLSTWVGVGERTGRVEAVFGRIREYFQRDVDQSSDMMMAMVEPAFTLAIGVFVFVLILQFVLPIFSLYGKVL